jgi:hypothetical protein
LGQVDYKKELSTREVDSEPYDPVDDLGELRGDIASVKIFFGFLLRAHAATGTTERRNAMTR